MSLQIIQTTPEPYIYPPKNFKISKKTGKLIRKKIKILRPLRIMTTTGLDTHYDGYFGILPSGVFQYIFQIATEMIEHEKKVEWDSRYTWSGRPFDALLHKGIRGQEALDNHGNIQGYWKTGNIINFPRNGWWRVDKKTPKTITLRRLEIAKDEKKYDPIGCRATHHSKFGRLTGRYISDQPPVEALIDCETKREIKALAKYFKDRSTKTIKTTGKLKVSCPGELLKFKGGELEDLKGKWIEIDQVRREPRPLEKGFNC